MCFATMKTFCDRKISLRHKIYFYFENVQQFTYVHL